jgi:hypothetical protein
MVIKRTMDRINPSSRHCFWFILSEFKENRIIVWIQVKYNHSLWFNSIKSLSTFSVQVTKCLVTVFLTNTKRFHDNIIWYNCIHHNPYVEQQNCQHTPLKTFHYQQHIHHLDFSSHTIFKQEKVQFPEQQIQVIPSHISQPLIKAITVNICVSFHFSIYYPHSKLGT